MSDPKIFIIDTDKEPGLKGLRLNIGSGRSYKPDFINIDKYDANADADWDIERLPIKDCRVAQIVCSDLLEHLEAAQIKNVLAECYRVLKLGGMLQIIVPDIYNICKQILDKPEDEWAFAHLYGNQSHAGQYHKYAFTQKRLQDLLGFAGFASLKMARFNPVDGIERIYVEASK